MSFKTMSGHYVHVTDLGGGRMEFTTRDAARNVISTVYMSGHFADQTLATLRSPGGRA